MKKKPILPNFVCIQIEFCILSVRIGTFKHFRVTNFEKKNIFLYFIDEIKIKLFYVCKFVHFGLCPLFLPHPLTSPLAFAAFFVLFVLFFSSLRVFKWCVCVGLNAEM